MKKWIIGLLLLLGLGLLCIYLFIPAQIKITNNIIASCDIRNLVNFMHDPQKWNSWWPEKQSAPSADASLAYHNSNYKLTKPTGNGGEIAIGVRSKSLKSTVSLFPLSKTSTAIVWETNLEGTNNPIRRLTQYMGAFGIKRDMQAILESFRNFMEKPENIYGIVIKKDKVKIDYMISTKKTFANNPSTREIYEMVASVRDYIRKQDGKEIAPPMLNVDRLDNQAYEAHVAIPVDKRLPQNEQFLFKWMPRGGNILITEVKGGPKTVERAEEQFRIYVTDQQLTEMAIPFQSLVTDRMNEPDTARWVTWLYYPIM